MFFTIVVVIEPRVRSLLLLLPTSLIGDMYRTLFFIDQWEFGNRWGSVFFVENTSMCIDNSKNCLDVSFRLGI